MSTYLQLAFLIVVTLFIVAWAIPSVREPLTRYKVFDTNTVIDAVALALFLTLGLLTAVHRKMSEVSQELKQVIGAGSNLILGGVGKVYPYLLDGIQRNAGRRNSSLEVLGLTLFSAWPQIQSWITDGSVRDVQIVLYCLDPEFIRKRISWIPEDWAAHATAQIEAIKRFRKERADIIAFNRVTVELCLYHGFPGVHGFRVGNAEIFISFAQWAGTGEQRRLSDPNHFYERFRPEDRSPRAEEYRNLLANWIDVARSRSPRGAPASGGQ